MKKTRSVISLFLVLAMLVSVLSVAVVSTGAAAANPYSEAAMALDAEYAYDGELGAIYTPESTTFKLWAPLATEVKLNRYATGSDSEQGAENLGSLSMEKLMDGEKWTGVWTAAVEGDLVNTYYTYTVTNPNHIYKSTGFKTVETQDPYSYAVGVNGDRTMIVDLDNTDPEGWDNDTHVLTDKQTEAIIWEVHVKDFSYNPNSGVSDANRGKFLGFTETGTTLNNEGVVSTGIDYLKNLGVTYVQINPMYDFATIDESGSDTQFNWGYDPKNYGVPEGSYSTNPYDGNVRINEAKAMIKALHEAGIGVIMDVVYNHTYSVDSCFTAAVPEYYYRMTATGSYASGSGCGNDTASERAMYRKYMRDMIKYWVNEYHIDGLRFDLMGLHDGETMNLIRDDMDAIDSRIMVYGEGWVMGTEQDPNTCTGTSTFLANQTNAPRVSDRVGFFNDAIRDGVKGREFGGIEPGFIMGTKSSAIATNIAGTSWGAISPEQVVSYTSCHDNYTLYDKMVYIEYINKNKSADYRTRYNDLIAENKLAASIISTAQGADFLLAGEEMGRSKDGDKNSYKSPATLNMIDWSLLETNADLVSYYRGLFELRKVFTPFTSNVSMADTNDYKYNFITSAGTSVNTVAYTIENNTPGEWNKIAVVYNGSTSLSPVTFNTTEDTSITQDTEWVIIVNDKQAGIKKLGEVKGKTFMVPAHSAIIAVEKNTFEACALKSSFTDLTVKCVYDKTGETLSEWIQSGKPGEGYSVSPESSIPIDYEVASIEGDPSGVYGEENKTVTFHFDDYVPTPFKAPYGDVNDDNEVDIDDATTVQRFLVGMVDLDAEHEARGDYDGDGSTEIMDVTVLQRWLSDMIPAICTITTHHLNIDTGEEVAADDIQRVRYGDSYKTDSRMISFYEYQESEGVTEGIAKRDATVTYKYLYSVKSPIIHVKHSGSATWAPYLWAWAYEGNDGKNGAAINSYKSWPGYKIPSADADGWYTTTFNIPGGLNYYFIISNNGNPQTKDYGLVNGENVGISYFDYPEIWVVIQDDLVGKNNGDWCKYYNYNPDLEN